MVGLRQLRLERSWTLDDVVEGLHRIASETGEPVPGVDRKAVSRWERGAHRPRPHYIRLLSALYEVAPAELGLPDSPASGEMRRRTFLKGGLAALSGVGADIALRAAVEALAATARTQGSEPDAITDEPVGRFQNLGAGYRTLYWTLSPARLLPLVDDHVQGGLSLLREPLEPSVRRRLAAALAESQLLAGRLLFFDLQCPEAASRRFRDSVDLADEARDGWLCGAALAHASFVPGFAGRTDEATALLDGAGARLRDRGARPVAGWLASVRAEVAALGGDAEASLAALARSEELVDRSLDAPAPPWFDWFDQPRLESFTGYCLLRARHASPAGATARQRSAQLARDRLVHALRGLDGNAAAKQQGVVLADLADAHVELGDLPEACTALAAAGSVARATEYAMAGTRVGTVRDRLRRRWGSEPMVRDLDALLTL